MRLAFVIPLVLGLSACAAVGDEAALAPAGDAQVDRLVDALRAAAANHPERLEPVRGDMSRLETALLSPPQAETARLTPSAPMRTPPAPAQPLRAPDLTGAASLFHGVHLASYRREAHLWAGWAALSATHGALAGLQPRIERADLGERGVYLRLKAGPLDTPQAARALCASLSAAGQYCAASDFTGAPLSARRPLEDAG